MKDRFDGAGGRPALLDALLGQKLVHGESDVAQAIADVVDLRDVAEGITIIEQGKPEDDVFLILSGAFMIVINGREWRRRESGDHVGEMAAIEPSLPRSASVIATEPSTVATMTRDQFLEIAGKHPQIWRRIAKELARRLNQRNANLRPPNHTPRLFVASSSESLPIAEALKVTFLGDPFELSLWTDIFTPSGYPLDSLDDALMQSDFAIVIAAADDVVTSRRKRRAAPRDNVTFELGLAIGKLSRKRVFLLEPASAHVRLASDVLGLTTVRYAWDPSGDPTVQLKSAAEEIRERVLDLGPA